MALTRSRDQMIGGVCAGIAEWLGWSATTVRILYVLGSFFSAAFPGILVYIILWVVMPSPNDDRRRGINERRSEIVSSPSADHL